MGLICMEPIETRMLLHSAELKSCIMLYLPPGAFIVKNPIPTIHV